MRCNSRFVNTSVRSVCQIYGPNELYGTLIANDGPNQWERTVRTVHHKLRSVSVRVYWTWMGRSKDILQVLGLSIDGLNNRENTTYTIHRIE